MHEPHKVQGVLQGGDRLHAHALRAEPPHQPVRGLLRMPDLSIEQVAHAVGYTCASRFSELFRRETGLLPSEYRRGLER
ncbi:MAG: helix-turn-helix domain-containing protein [Eggerthellaceae bacterium]